MAAAKGHKRLVVCTDGTWNDHVKGHPTNVIKIARAVKNVARGDIPQIVYYHQGVGTGTVALDHLLGGSTGWGISQNIRDAYNFLIMNYEVGDEIFLFGFSRGAYTARSLAGLIRNVGILRPECAELVGKAYDFYRDRSPATTPDAPESVKFRRDHSHGDHRIHFVGVWDTVGALGVPLGFARYALKILGAFTGSPLRYEFHDVELSSRIDHAAHAVSRHEQREAFRPTLWKVSHQRDHTQTFAQEWFNGVHCDVGGGYAVAGLSDVALEWMARHAQAAGLELDLSVLNPCVAPNCAQKPQNSQTLMYRTLAILKKLNALTVGVGFSREEIVDLRANVDWYGDYKRTGEEDPVDATVASANARGPRTAA